MPKAKSARKARAEFKQKERRLAAKAGPLRRVWRWMSGLLRRPLGFMRNQGHLRFGFVERRQAPPDALEAAELRADLRSRMLAYPPDHAAHMLSHLVQVHDEYGRGGWVAVTALPPSVLQRALFQAQMLLRDGSSPPLKKLIERLRQSQPAREKPVAEEAEPAKTRPRPTGAELEISEASQEDFDATERSWFGTLPPPTPETPAAPEVRP
jgi:hypothetical protein